MRPFYDDFDEFEFDDSVAVKQMLREMEREDLRMASRRRRGPSNKKRWDDDFDDDLIADNPGAHEDYEIYDDYDDDEFDSYSGLDVSQ